MKRPLLAVVAILAILALFVSGTLAVQGQGQAGTTLTAEKTAAGWWKIYRTYDWSLTKSVTPTSMEIPAGQSGTFTYTLTATRTLVSEQEVFGVSGEICVTNGGDRVTENLKLVDQVEYKTGDGQFQPLPGASQTIIPSAQLGPGESACYPYSITFIPVAGAIYRNSVKITITNHSGHLGEEWGPEPKAGFFLPSEPTVIEYDAEADVTDSLTCPDGFSCQYTCCDDPCGPQFPVHLTDSRTGSYCVVITNVSAMCDTYYEFPNTATLTEKDSGETRTATANVTVYSGPCAGGCTLTIGYWKTHAGFTGRNPDRVTPLLPIWLGNAGGAKSVQVTTASQAVNILSMGLGHPSNGITKLYAQLLAAKLNIKNGADGSAVADVITAADDFLAMYDYTAWSSLSKAQRKMVLGWMTTLDYYNNGYIGPGHCD
ncbi:MAG: hypothetical protein H5T60_06570 [Anaerolineae bacterium]|nr:hypothetical protein [Anaerolineae bacterium]